MDIVDKTPSDRMCVNKLTLNNNPNGKYNHNNHLYCQQIKLNNKTTPKNNSSFKTAINKFYRIAKYATLGIFLNVASPMTIAQNNTGYTDNTYKSVPEKVENQDIKLLPTSNKLKPNQKDTTYTPNIYEFLTGKKEDPNIKLNTFLNDLGLDKNDKTFINNEYERLTGEKENPDIKLFSALNNVVRNQNDTTLLKDTYEFITGDNESLISKDIEWPSNIRILASTGQNTLGYSDKTSYSSQLADLVSSDKINSLEQANDSLAKGYKIRCDLDSCSSFDNILKIVKNKKVLHSLETPGQKLNIFNKQAKNKERYVICLYTLGEERFSNEVDYFADKMQKTYNIPKENITNISLDNFNRMSYTIKDVAEKIKKLKNPKDAEVVILFSGHGDAEALKKGQEKLEGAMNGKIASGDNPFLGYKPIEEAPVKKLFKEALGSIKTLFILDTCHSGAWIAQNPSTKTIKKVIAKITPQTIKKLKNIV